MPKNLISRAAKTIARTISIAACATNLKDFFYLTFYSAANLVALPLYYLNFNFYLKFLRAVHGAMPDIIVKTKYGRFFCEAGTDTICSVLPTYEKELTEVFENFRNDGGVFIDVGAHVGRYSIIFGNKFGKRGRVLAFEPTPKTFNSLKKNIELNKAKNIDACQTAVLDKNCKANFFVFKESGCNSLFGSDFAKGGTKIKVDCRKLDDLVKQKRISPKDISLIKIDVEGAPDKVLLGAREILEKSNAKIIFEALNRAEFEKCKNILEKFNYKIRGDSFDRINFLAEKS